MIFNERVVTDPGIIPGRPVIRGTRITVELIARKLGERAGLQDLVDACPLLGGDDIRAALACAADSLAHEKVIRMSMEQGRTLPTEEKDLG